MAEQREKNEEHASQAGGHEGLLEKPCTLPEDLDSSYEVESCLKCTEKAVTYLLRDRLSGKHCLLKVSEDPLHAKLYKNEYDLLAFIHHTDSSWISGTFAHSICLKEQSKTTYYIRSYIEGSTLEELCESGCGKPGIEPVKALNYVIALTELLQFLHSLNPPVIHRDIKPQNIVIDPAGNCHFIDLDISRFFQKEKAADTLIMGTRLTAPPEQFGYQQTDTRSDLYSMGVLLFYCITGKYEIDEGSLGELPAAIVRIVQKATMFDPDKRYQTADELLADLLAARYPSLSGRSAVSGSRHILPRLTGLALLAFCCITLTVLLTGRYLRGRLTPEVRETYTRMPEEPSAAVSRDPEEPSATVSRDPEAAAYTFQEPLIEEAVRLQLGISDRPVTAEDLEQITQIHIFGLQIFQDDEEIALRSDSPWYYDNRTRNAGLYLQTGPITSLEDIRHMPNLSVLSLYGQQISDISALRDLRISELGLGWNPLTDLSPLEGNESLHYLCLSDLDISDTSVISTLKNLNSLNISGTSISSLKELENCDLTSLNLYGVPLMDYSELKMFPNLQALEIDILTDDMLRQLEGVPLQHLICSFSTFRSLSSLSVFPDLRSLRLGGNNGAEMTFDNPDLRNLRTLNLERITIPDFKGTSTLESLTNLQIYDSVCLSYDELDQMPLLHDINCTEEQQEEIRGQFPDNPYVLF